MSAQDEQRFIEDTAIALAMFCDERSYTLDDGREFAERVADAVQDSAEDRASYLEAASAS